jgi:hypothetical protein
MKIVSETEDTVSEIDQTVKEHEKMLWKYEEKCKTSGTLSKTQSMKHVYRRKWKD